MSTSNYWADRQSRAQNAITNKTHRQINKQLSKYYSKSMKRVIADFESTYDKLLLTVAEGQQPTPADLYKLDKYWAMQAQLRKEATKLGNYMAALYSKMFEINYWAVYNSINIKGLEAFNTIDKAAARQMINTIWVADGQSYSSRIWNNTAQLIETLNEELINCVVSGKKTSDLKKLLQQRFNVSYHRADALATTELAHVQTIAAQQRYKDYGIKEYEFYADPDERTCEVCGKLHKQRFPITSTPKVPQHVRCRCVILPVIDVE